MVSNKKSSLVLVESLTDRHAGGTSSRQTPPRKRQTATFISHMRALRLDLLKSAETRAPGATWKERTEQCCSGLGDFACRDYVAWRLLGPRGVLLAPSEPRTHIPQHLRESTGQPHQRLG